MFDASNAWRSLRRRSALALNCSIASSRLVTGSGIALSNSGDAGDYSAAFEPSIGRARPAFRRSSRARLLARARTVADIALRLEASDVRSSARRAAHGI